MCVQAGWSLIQPRLSESKSGRIRRRTPARGTAAPAAPKVQLMQMSPVQGEFIGAVLFSVLPLVWLAGSVVAYLRHSI
jgi:hypothetical protein